jgi:hypothetical protein
MSNSEKIPPHKEAEKNAPDKGAENSSPKKRAGKKGADLQPETPALSRCRNRCWRTSWDWRGISWWHCARSIWRRGGFCTGGEVGAVHAGGRGEAGGPDEAAAGCVPGAGAGAARDEEECSLHGGDAEAGEALRGAGAEARSTRRWWRGICRGRIRTDARSIVRVRVRGKVEFYTRDMELQCVRLRDELFECTQDAPRWKGQF